MTVEPGTGTHLANREENDARAIERSREEPGQFAALSDRHAGTVHGYDPHLG
jgi:RNA polymerase sigma-70 factor (ECF subfamily)